MGMSMGMVMGMGMSMSMSTSVPAYMARVWCGGCCGCWCCRSAALLLGRLGWLLLFMACVRRLAFTARVHGSAFTARDHGAAFARASRPARGQPQRA